jgi:hypothetical protein
VESTSDLNPRPGALAYGSSASLTVNYQTYLNGDEFEPIIRGRDRQGAAKVTIYVVYAHNNEDVAVPLNVTIQDCSCCGAMVSATEWKQFMCHNLGADESANPFTPSAAIHGAKYKWGSKEPALTQEEDQLNSGGVSGWGASSPASDAWQPDQKAPDDPCPAGWRVPSSSEFQAIWDNNAKTKLGPWDTVNDLSGAKVGPVLFLPAAGKRQSSSGTIIDRGLEADYLTSTYGTTYYRTIYQKNSVLAMTPNCCAQGSMQYNASWPYIAASVRCIEQ